MPVLLFLLLVTACSAEDLATTCLLADSSARVVYSVGVGPEQSEPEVKYISNNAISGVCLDQDAELIFAAGAGIKLVEFPEEFAGGHIASIGISGVPVRVAYFLAKSTAVECDPVARVIVYAVEKRGIFGSSYDGSEQWTSLYVLGSEIQNIFLDAATQTCYFVDITTSDIYALKYMESPYGRVDPIGRAGAGAVGCTLNADSLNVVYDDCRIEQCPIDGPFTDCQVLRPSTEGSCLAVAATDGSVITYDNHQHTLSKVRASDGFVTETSVTTSGSSFIAGMDCTSHDAIDVCDPNPCLNDGVCEFAKGGYHCICAASFAGVICEDALEYEGHHCDPNPCLYGSTCIDLVDNYECICVSGLYGHHCEHGSPELIALRIRIQEFEEGLNSGNFSILTQFYAVDTIIDFLDFPQLRGKDGHAQLVLLLKEEYNIDYAITSSKEIRQLCNVCFEVRFTRQMFPVDPQEPVVFIRLLQIWCFDFESLKWQVKSLSVTPDPQEGIQN